MESNKPSYIELENKIQELQNKVDELSIYANIFKNLFYKSAISTEYYDLAGNLIECNPACLDFFGIENIDEIKGLNLFDNPHITEKEKQLLQDGNTIRFELEYSFDLIKSKRYYKITRSGIYFLDCFITSFCSQKNLPFGYIVQSINISEQKKAENLLKSVNLDFENVNKVLIENNLAYEALNEELTQTNEELNGKNEEFLSINEELRQTNEELFKMKEKAEERQRKYRTLYESLSDAYVMFNLKGEIVEFNSAFCEMIGYQRNEIFKLTNISITPEKWYKKEFDIINNEIFKKGFSEIYEKEYFKKDGTVIPVELRTFLIKNINGEPDAMWAIVRDITNRKIAENELIKAKEKAEENERFSNTLFEQIPLSIQIFDKQGLTIKANNAWENLWHFPLNKVINKYNVLDDTYADKIGWLDYIRKAFNGETVIIPEMEYDPNLSGHYGRKRILRCLVFPIKYKEEISNIVIVHQDVTELKDYEGKLTEAKENAEKSEQNFKKLLDLAPDAFLQGDTNGNFIKVNNKAITLTGYSKEELLKMNMKDIFTDSVLNRVSLRYDLLNQGLNVINERDILRKDGALIQVEMNSRKMPDNTYQSFIRDITERKKTAEKLRESELQFRKLLEMLPVGIAIHSNGKIKYINKIVPAIMNGKTKEDFIDKPIINFVHPDYQYLFQQRIKNTIDRNEILPLNEKKFITLDNKIIDVEVTSLPAIFDNELSVLFVFQDITDRKKTQTELILAKEKAEESDRLKSSFLANMSHEIRTPMNGILGFADQLTDPELNEVKRKQYVQIINNCGNQLVSIIDDLIDIAKIESNQLKIFKSKVNINNILLELYNIFKSKAKLTNLNIYLNQGLKDTECEIITDGNRIRQILSNLLSNSIKFTQSGYIKFGYIFKEKHIEFFVEDTGIGIEENKHAIIFDRFRQAEDSTSQYYGGSGLGLAISKSLVHLLGGQINVKSQINKGSYFYFTIPLDDETYKKIYDTKNAIFHENNNIKQILIAEDDDANYLLIEEILMKFNFKIFHAKNGIEVLNIYNQNKIDLILMDIKMPLMNGYEAIREIRKIDTKIPIIAQTAYVQSVDINLALEAGCTEHLSKPIKKFDLLNLINKYIA